MPCLIRQRRSSSTRRTDSIDRGRIGLVLIGMPDIEKRLGRDPQFYSRMGFALEFRKVRPNFGSRTSCYAVSVFAAGPLSEPKLQPAF